MKVDVYIRKERARLFRLYLERLLQGVDRNLVKLGGEVVWLSLQIGDDPRVRSDEWLQTLPTKFGAVRLSDATKGVVTRACRAIARRFAAWHAKRLRTADRDPTFRVAIDGRGGVGKTVLVYAAIRELIAARCASILFEALRYEGDSSFEQWMARVFALAQKPVPVDVVLRLPNVVYVIDQASEAPVKFQAQFRKLLENTFATDAPPVRLLVAGRDVQELLKGTGNWDELVLFGALDNGDIRRLGQAYLHPSGPTAEIDALPKQVKQVMKEPTPFLVSHYMRTRRESLRPVTSESDLFAAILEAQVRGDAFAARPDVVRELLVGLVEANYARTRDRGLPGNRQILLAQVDTVIKDRKLFDYYGSEGVPTPDTFVRRLTRSGLVDAVTDRFVFFHDAFEDWLVEQTSTIKA